MQAGNGDGITGDQGSCKSTHDAPSADKTASYQNEQSTVHRPFHIQVSLANEFKKQSNQNQNENID